MVVETNHLRSSIDLEAVEKYVKKLMEENLPIHIYFHDFKHTQNVKNQAILLGEKMKLKAEDLEVLTLAALFHDTGFTVSYKRHEEESQAIASTYLKNKNYPDHKIKQVLQLVHVSRTNVAPASLMEKILVDADTSHLGQKKYRTVSELLWKERIKNLPDYQPSELDWRRENYAFLQNHNYYTKAAKKEYGERKSINLKKARKRLLKAEKKREVLLDEFSITKNKAALTMFKTALRNHIDLTAIADQKANMMLSITALILTIGMPVFASYLGEKVFLLVPSVIFMLTCIITMVFATLSTRPIKMDGETDISKINTGKTNLFFFGNFYNIDLTPYQEAIKKVIANKENLDNSIINDLYFLGLSLGDKFRHLRTCYNVFIIGMILALLSFLISFTVFNWS